MVRALPLGSSMSITTNVHLTRPSFHDSSSAIERLISINMSRIYQSLLRQSQWQRSTCRYASTTSAASNAASNVTSQASQGLTRVTSTAGAAMGNAGQAASRAINSVGGTTGRVVNFAQCEIILRRIHGITTDDLRSSCPAYNVLCQSGSRDGQASRSRTQDGSSVSTCSTVRSQYSILTMAVTWRHSNHTFDQ